MTESTGTEDQQHADDVDQPAAEGADAESAGSVVGEADASLLDAVRSLDRDDLEAMVQGAGSEEAALERVKLLAHLMDDAVKIPGTDYRVGLDPILGILPIAGDSVSAVLSLYPVVEAVRLGASKATLAKMLALVGIDFAVGSIPVLGTLFDAVWKANEWNVATIERLIEAE